MTTTPAPEEQAHFVWGEEKRHALLLPAFIILSLLAHGATFFLFQVTYPQQVTIPAPAPAVSVLDPSRVEHQSILRWIAAADPALSAISSIAEPKGLMDVQYRPSFFTPSTPLRYVAAESEPVRFPPVMDAPTLIRRIEQTAEPPPAPLPAAETRLTFTGALIERAPQVPFKIAMKVNEVPQHTRFFLGVSADGKTKYTFLQSSSGNAGLDLAAEAALQNLQFTPSNEELTWGNATIEWGDEIFERPQVNRASTP